MWMRRGEVGADSIDGVCSDKLIKKGEKCRERFVLSNFYNVRDNGDRW